MSTKKSDKDTTVMTLVDPKSLPISELINLLGERLFDNGDPNVHTDGKLDIKKLIDSELASDPDVDVEHQLGILIYVTSLLTQGWHVGVKDVTAKRIEIRFPESEDGTPVTFAPGYETAGSVKATVISDDSSDTRVVEILCERPSKEKKKARKTKGTSAAGTIRVLVNSVRRRKRHGGKR